MTRKKSKPDTLIDELIEVVGDPKDTLGENGLLKQPIKRLVERLLEAELADHLGYEPHEPKGRGTGMM